MFYPNSPSRLMISFIINMSIVILTAAISKAKKKRRIIMRFFFFSLDLLISSAINIDPYP